MRIKYANKKVEQQCTSLKAATKLFGGNKTLARSLMTRIEFIERAEALKDVIVMPQFHFHNLHGEYEGLFAVDVKSRKDKWRIILEPLNAKEKPFDPCHIDEIASIVRLIDIREVSPHYE